MHSIDFSETAKRAKLPISEQLKPFYEEYDEKKEYIDESGLIYCLKCHAPKITIINYGVDKLVVPCPCNCILEQRKIREQQEAEQKYREIMARRRVKSLLVGQYERAKFDLTDLTGADKSFIEAYQRLQKYAEIHCVARSNGYGVYLWGKCGVGKSYLSACLANRLLEKGCNVLFTNMVKVAFTIRETFGQRYGNNNINKIINELTGVDFLFLDDFGTEEYAVNGQDNWLQNIIYSILDSRLTERKPTIFTSNCSIEELNTKRGLSIKNTNRVVGLSTAIINIQGMNYRFKSRKEELPF